MEPLKFCRVCLVTDVRMYSLDTTSKHSVGVIYSHLAQIQIPDSYQHVCFECASLLQKYQMFKSKCLRAHSILCDVLDNSSVLTKQIIQRIDRKKNKLESNLQKKNCDPYKIVNKYCEDHQLESEVKSELQTHNYGECSGTKISCEINRSSLKISSEILTNSKKSNTTNCCDSTNDSLCKNSEKHFEVLKIDKEDYQPEFRGSQEKIHESSFTKDCYKDNSETVAKNKNNTFKEHKHKKRKINKEKLKTKIKTNSIDAIHDSVDDFDDNYLTESSDKNVPVEKKKTLTDKSDDMKKKLKSKKRKVNSVFYSDDNASDDEPLLKNDNIITDKSNSKKLRLDLEFHNYATVVWLTSDDAIKELVARKESKNYKISPFKCDFCYKGYEAKAAYENHMKRHSADSGAYECEICHLRFPKTEFLCKHKLSCHKRKFSCKLCPYVCYCMYQARTHVSLHKGKKYPCKDCGEIFSMPNSLFMHKRLKHLNDSVEESVCELCGDVFGSPRGLFLHHNKLHRTEKNKKQGPECEECRIHFTSEIAWKRHLVLSTRHIVTNGCKYCGDRFTNEDDLKSHIRANHQRMPRKKTDIELPAACPLCKVWLSNRIEYKNHMNKQHPQSEEALKLASDNLASYVCEVCGQAFKLQCFLIYHQRKHTGERPYKCQDCGKTFQMSGALSIHRSVHAQKLTYKCDTCAKIFSSKSALNKHMKLHLGIRPHKCTICDKGFLHMCDLRLHIKYVHDKVPWPKKKSKQNIADENVSYEGFN